MGPEMTFEEFSREIERIDQSICHSMRLVKEMEVGCADAAVAKAGIETVIEELTEKRKRLTRQIVKEFRDSVRGAQAGSGGGSK